MKRNKLKKGGQILYIPIEYIKSDSMKSRIYFNNDDLVDLCESISQEGIIKPLTVRDTKDGYYIIISGERRFRAALLAGYDKLPCIIVKLSDEDAAFVSLTENLHQCTLNFFEIPLSVEKIHSEFCISYNDIAERIGINLNELTELLKLLSVPPDLRIKIIENGITEKHTKELIRLNDEDKYSLVNEIIDKRLNLSKTRQRCKEILYNNNTANQKTVTYFKDITVFVNTIDNTINRMLKSGINAQSTKNEQETFIEYRVLIPK